MGFFAALKLQFPNFEVKQTDLFVPNGTHVKKAKFFCIENNFNEVCDMAYGEHANKIC